MLRLLVGVDVPGNFLSEKAAHIIKGLVGGDFFDAEQKGGTGSFKIQGIPSLTFAILQIHFLKILYKVLVNFSCS